MARLRTGILGGAFDPIHQGHMHVAVSVLDSGLVDQLLIMPTGHPAYKACMACAEDRWKMVVAAASADKRLIPSRMEIDRTGTIYSVDTLLALRDLIPDTDFFYILGEDAMMNLHKWHRLNEVVSLCSFLICRRPDHPLADQAESEKRRLISMGARISDFRIEPVSASSTGIREAFSRGETPAGLCVPVREFCRCKGLYGAAGKMDEADRWISQLFDALKPTRFAHSLSVADTSRLLALRFGENPLQAEQAGLLHDCAKCLPLSEMQKIARDHQLTQDESILSTGALLHSVAGAWLARERYGVTDPEVLEAIAWHNTGHVGMSRLAMCVCLADYIEPMRRDIPHLQEVRAMAESSLERALLLSLENTSDYVLSRGGFLHPNTTETIAWLKTQL